MQEQDTSIERFNAIIDREIERHPHNRALLDAFRPILIARACLLETMRAPQTTIAVLDKERFQAGVSVMGQQGVFQADAPWKEIALAMIPAVQKGFPGQSGYLARIGAAFRDGTMDLLDFFKTGPQDSEALTEAWAKSLAVPISIIGFVLRQITRIMMEKKAQSIADLIKDNAWDKGYCPACGGFPSIAVIKEKIGERLLHCSSCGQDWRFSRVICPYCEHEGQQGMNFFFVEDKAQESVYTCDHCQRYLITLSKMSDLNDRDLDVAALGLVHLDVLMQEKSFTPMAVTDWNNLG